MEMAKRMMRLDKYLANMEIGTRTEVKKIIRKGLISINGNIQKTPEYKVSDEDVIEYQGERVQYEEYQYYMLNKPQGVLSATTDRNEITVLDLLKGVSNKNLFPVGRLDKDTEGLLLLTNNGRLANELLSPKKHVPKKYYARIKGEVTQLDIDAFKNGLDIGEKNRTLPAKLEILESGTESIVEITIHEGKFHQIKRMFHAVDKEVSYLKRIEMGKLKLDNNLKLGEFKKLSKWEASELC